MGTPTRGGPGIRLLLVLPAAGLLLLGLNAGLLLLGAPAWLVTDRLPELHAPLLVLGFLGTLISVERAVALRVGWAYAAPVLIGWGALLALTPLPAGIGRGLVTAGFAVHLWQYRGIWRRQPMTATAVQALGALSGLAAALAWTGGVAAPRLVPLFAAFLVLTITGERLELARVAAPPVAAERMLFALSLAYATATLLSLTSAPVAVPASGVLLVGLVGWLLRYDVARTLVRRRGLVRYVAACLLTGYAWLAAAGVGWVLGGARTEGAVYDATTHAVFLGFVMTMIMAHAPIILPAVLRLQIPYHRALYAPVALLQLSLLVRVVAGDAWGSIEALRLGGMGAAASLLGFAATAAGVAMLARRDGARERGSDVAA